MTTTRRSFLASLGIAAAAPAVMARAVAAPVSPILRYPNPATIPAIWARQCGWKGNPAWVMYDLLVAQYGAGAVDRESCARLAAYCEERLASDTDACEQEERL